MTHPAFTALLDAARAAHATHADLAEFCAFPDDLTTAPTTPFHIPAARLMEQDQTLAGAHPLARAFLAASPHAQWRETYKATDIGADFMDRFACYCLIGAGGPWVSGQFSAYVVYMPPHLHYRWHHHPAEELYFVLAGQAEFYREGAAPETLRAGQSSFHASGQPHAMQTRDSSVMAYVLWRNHLETPPVLTEREVA